MVPRLRESDRAYPNAAERALVEEASVKAGWLELLSA